MLIEPRRRQVRPERRSTRARETRALPNAEAPGPTAPDPGANEGARSGRDVDDSAYSGTPSKKSTIPVSSEYSAPTTTNPSVWIICSITDDPCRN
jgi:hypothetical protein